MTVPNEDFNVQVPEKVLDASKAVNAALVALGTLAGEFVLLMSDGNLTGTDVGTLVASVLGAITTVGAVFRTANKPKS